MRNIPLAEVDDLDRAVLAIATDYPPEHFLPRHEHRRAQVLYAATGVMRVETTDGTWTVPTDRAVLIPPGTRHQVTMTGVTTCSLYIEAGAVPWFPARCRVVEVSALLRELVLEAVDMAPRYPPHGRDATLAALVLHELRSLAPLPLDLPLPAEPRLRRLCDAFLRAPDIHDPPARWAGALNVSERTLGRLFHRGTGLGFAQWRQRACVLHAVQRLAAGEPVGRLAATLGYENPAAFTAAFKTVLGRPPSAYKAPEHPVGRAAPG
ncbi:AraC family transcriptional regulator [Streptantibioticus cattleyicolor]|uniref:HTH-type transcriptional regulator RipA n=1 Tax=Streptantibioticus cattleyicolor (strain ATCC 35852 / DSM 46488 / JCM 4925 / NBRC 14057 / NRRL 8057) TaxID=1003195 RepID=F8JMG1_STREN|nr:helix-turn-helix transcriptional regulator [Streptantibioticus cattleyicolor]AEW99361.1 DNA-binding domain-containing protein, AraC-type [Streptantibioticus cattleyicolor NRRL 8057 = DSM 46488]CCB71599.1 DNA-binding domain-containing protein, AraC-type [Streptantibioticus cattleyicolor NRRL 8057 = DSM 46488]